MKTSLIIWWKSVQREIKAYIPYYILLTVILLVAFFVRVYRIEDLLGFYYDQGRDALVIWKLWHEGKPFLIGPITGLQGIYLGPFYYYLIAPLYLIGGGNPVYPAVFLSFLSTLAVLMLYVLGKEMHSRLTGIFAATIGAFSYYLVLHSRWLSNPNPILLLSTILVYALWKIVESNDKIKSNDGKWWIIIALTVGLSLQLESASAVYYIPIVLIFIMWLVFSQRPGLSELAGKIQLPRKKTIVLAGFVFLLALLPQIIFNFRHENILFNNFKKLFLQERAFRAVTPLVFEERFKFFWSVFSNKLYAGLFKYLPILVAFTFSALFVRRKKLKKGTLKLFAIFLVTPMVGYIFFQGNYGNIYDYYMSGYFLPSMLLFAIGLGQLWRTYIGKVIVIVFFVAFLNQNKMLLTNYLTAEKLHERPIVLEDQLKAVDWVFNNAKGRGNFNLDVYVPPVIPHAYDYLFLWQGSVRCGKDLCGKVEEQVSLLYTLYEEDPPHPERLEVWMERQEGIGVVEEEAEFGMITVQRRKRI